jgi:hypothetical protein
MQNFIAEVCIGASALRGQGGSGLIQCCRDFFKRIDFSKIPMEQKEFAVWLETNTEELRATFPKVARNYGAARKALNLFLRDASYNVILNRAYDLDRLLPLLEVPVDSFTANHLHKYEPSIILKKWDSLKRVKDTELKKYQEAAQLLAEKWGINRVDLDAFFYREKLED